MGDGSGEVALFTVPRIRYSSAVTIPGAGISAANQTASRIERYLDIVAPKLLQVEEELRKKFDSDVLTIREVGDHVLEGGGKRLRPMLVLLVSDMLGYEGSRDITFAAVIEFIHTATLVHDDIIDEAAVRRGKTSVNYRWGNHLTVLIGDFLYAHAMDIGLEDGGVDVLRLLSKVTIRMTEGEILGLERNGRADLTLDDYFDIVERKTAALFAASCRIGALLTKESEDVGRRLWDYGLNLGICFQLVDDLLDFTSSTEVLGKPVLADLKEGKLTLPLILALPQATPEERQMIERVLSEKTFGDLDPTDIVSIANRYGSIDETRVIAREYADRAREAISIFPSSRSLEALEWAVDFVLSRDR
ncbi:MAG: polyprenyl synthetase family protein [Thermoanaerobaculia bacterium]